MIRPSLHEFTKLAKRYTHVPVFLECLADEITPMSLLHSFYKESASCFLLESVEGGENLGRYSFAAFDPEEVFRSQGPSVSVNNGRFERRIFSDDPLSELQNILKMRRVAEVDGLPRFFGGAVGYASYDMVRSFEKIPKVQKDDRSIPESFFFLTKDMFIFDHVSHTVKVVRCLPVDSKKNLEKQYKDAEKSLTQLMSRIKLTPFVPRYVNDEAIEEGKKKVAGHLSAEDRKEKIRFMSAVQRIKKYILEGDVIQTVLSRRIKTPLTTSPLDVYRILRRINPSPYMYFLKDKQVHIIGSSPEMLVRLEDDTASTRPIAGTRPRGDSLEADHKHEADLLKDRKEQAEHVMLVDLGRNDLGRVCRSGSVKVSDFMTVERYSHVMHMVSNVQGRLEPSKNAFDLFRACFPAGTVTGAPKIRAMEIIEELEDVRRGPYAGAVGYFSYNGNMDMAITIRTIVTKGKDAYVQAGAGIVADSDPEKEFVETQNKAAAMVAAIQLSEKNKNRN